MSIKNIAVTIENAAIEVANQMFDARQNFGEAYVVVSGKIRDTEERKVVFEYKNTIRDVAHIVIA